MEAILAGFADAFTLGNIIYLALGVGIGVIVGALPGLNGPMAIALMVPITYYMGPLIAVAFLIGLNKGASFGGSIAAILLNTPGTPEAAATCFDGYPLAKQGKGEKALKISLYASVTGDTFSDLVLIFVAAPIATLALKMGPPEIFAVIVFALAMIAGLEADSLLKGLIGACLGITFACVGLDPVSAMPRLAFDIMELEEGISVITVGIGLLALSEIIVRLEEMKHEAQQGDNGLIFDKNISKADRTISWAEYRSCGKTIFRSSLIGTALGALPGLGATIASFLGYGAAKRASKDPDSFGKGNIEGVAAAEAANNAVIGANLIPLFTLGIPGNVASAMLIGAFIIHGVTPGPLLFEENGQLIYGIYGAMLIANVLNLLIGNIGLRFFAKALSISSAIVFPIIMFVCMTGAYMANNSIFNVYMMFGFAFLGFLLKKLKISFITFIIGFVLTPMLELSFQQTLIMSRNNPFIVLQRPISCGFIILTAFFIWRMAKKPAKKIR